MRNRNGIIRPPEHFGTRARSQAAPEQPFDGARVERLFLQRVELLQSIQADISGALYEAICAKLDYERKFLSDRIAQYARAAESKRRSVGVLKSEYFRQKTLDAHIL